MSNPPPPAAAPPAALAQLPQLLADGNLPQIHQLLDTGQLAMLGQYLTGEQMGAFEFSVHAGDIDAARASVEGVEIPGVGVLWPKSRSPWPIVAIVVAVLAVLGLGAWLLFGGGDDDLQPIPDTLSSNSDYTTFAGLIEKAGLTELLSETGPFTVFAPNNKAFEALPEGEMDVLNSDNQKLREVVEYHVTVGKKTAEELTGQIPTEEGDDLTVEGSGSSLTVNGAKVVDADMEATNGIIQGIDAVLIPPGMDLTTPPSQNIVELLSGNPNYSTLAGLITTAGLSETLSAAGPFTVFAPQNTAFAALPPEQLETLQSDVNLLRSVLNYHVVAGNLTTSDMETGQLNSVEGSELSVVVSGDKTTVNGAEIVDSNLVASNGVVQGIDAVLVPPGIDLNPTTTTTESTTTVAPTTAAPTTAAPTTTTEAPSSTTSIPAG